MGTPILLNKDSQYINKDSQYIRPIETIIRLELSSFETIIRLELSSFSEDIIQNRLVQRPGKEAKVKILFVINELGFIDPLAIALLSGVARDLGHERYLCVLRQQDVSKCIKDTKPDLIAYSINSCDATEVFRIHQQIVKSTGIFSIMGGAHPTLYPESLVESGTDAYCIGEGEEAFADVLCSLSAGKSIDNIPNIHTATRQNQPRRLALLSTLPMPDRDLALSNKFLSDFPRKMFLTSRGCAYSCAYCFNSALRKIYQDKGKWIRRFSVCRVIHEIKDVRAKHKLEFVKFDDDNFAMQADDWLEEFAERYTIEIGIPFNCLLRLDNVSDKLLRLLKKAGCYSITTSVDSANQRIREEILNRSSTINKDLIIAMRQINSYHINLFVNYITAIPTATEKDELDTIRLSKLGKVTYSNYTTLVPFQGTRIWQYCRDKGFHNDTTNPRSLMRPTVLQGFSKQQRRVQRNVLLLGAYNYIIPKKLLNFFIKLLQHLPTNITFIVPYTILKSWIVGTKIYHNHCSLTQNIKITVKATQSDIYQVDSYDHN